METLSQSDGHIQKNHTYGRIGTVYVTKELICGTVNPKNDNVLLLSFNLKQ